MATLIAKWNSQCAACNGRINAGDRITGKRGSFRHATCPQHAANVAAQLVTASASIASLAPMPAPNTAIAHPSIATAIAHSAEDLESMLEDETPELDESERYMLALAFIAERGLANELLAYSERA